MLTKMISVFFGFITLFFDIEPVFSGFIARKANYPVLFL